MNIFQSPLGLAIVAAILYGIGSPLMKVAYDNGATGFGVALAYSVGMVVCSLGNASRHPFGNTIGTTATVIAGLVLGIAWVAVSKAYGSPRGYVSIIAVIVAAYPLVSTAISMAFLREAAQVNIARVITGSLVMIAGLYLVATSTLASTK